MLRAPVRPGAIMHDLIFAYLSVWAVILLRLGFDEWQQRRSGRECAVSEVGLKLRHEQEEETAQRGVDQQGRDVRAARLREEERAGKDQRINAQNAEATAARLVERLAKRQAELDRERQISALPPVLKGAALVIPGGLLAARAPAAPSPETEPDGFAEDPIARAAIGS